jgi:hypothetical protein
MPGVVIGPRVSPQPLGLRSPFEPLDDHLLQVVRQASNLSEDTA